MPDPLRLRGYPDRLERRTIARVTREIPQPVSGADSFVVVPELAPELFENDLSGCSAILVEDAALPIGQQSTSIPVVSGYADLSFLTEGTILAVNPDGETFVLYRPDSQHNSIYATGRCNSNCIMCSQPPVGSEPDDMVREHLRLIDLIQGQPECLGITGGEPTMLKGGLVTVLDRLHRRFPETQIHMLTNGRMFAYSDFSDEVAAIGHERLLLAIPLYADNAVDHDWIVQAEGAFDQTIKGLYNCAERGLESEIRIVLHQQTVGRLRQTVDFIYRNLPFVSHVALMGLENMGYVKKNWETLWVDPLDYAEELEEAVSFLFYRGIPVSIYNLQLCVLPKNLWCYARKSISDYKNVYLEVCSQCAAHEQCGGLFKSSELRHSRGIHALAADEIANLAC